MRCIYIELLGGNPNGGLNATKIPTTKILFILFQQTHAPPLPPPFLLLFSKHKGGLHTDPQDRAEGSPQIF